MISQLSHYYFACLIDLITFKILVYMRVIAKFHSMRVNHFKSHAFRDAELFLILPNAELDHNFGTTIIGNPTQSQRDT